MSSGVTGHEYQHSSTPSLQPSFPHLNISRNFLLQLSNSSLLGKSHHDDLIIFDVFLEFMIDLGMKDILAQVAEDALRFGAKKKSVKSLAALGWGA